MNDTPAPMSDREFRDALATAPAGRAGAQPLGDDRDLGDPPAAIHHHMGDGGRLGAPALRKAHDLDIAAAIDAPVFGAAG